MLVMLARGTIVPPAASTSGAPTPMAGFEVSTYGRFWVSTEGAGPSGDSAHRDHAARAANGRRLRPSDEPAQVEGAHGGSRRCRRVHRRAHSAAIRSAQDDSHSTAIRKRATTLVLCGDHENKTDSGSFERDALGQKDRPQDGCTSWKRQPNPCRYHRFSVPLRAWADEAGRCPG